MPRRSVILLALTLALPVLAQTEPPPASETLDKDSPRATPAGTTFTAPAGWTVTTKGSMVILDPPEPDSHVAIVDATAKDADAAVAAAWAAYEPDFRRPLKIAVPQTAKDGWEERKAFVYETSPNERAVVRAFAWRARRGRSFSSTALSRRSRNAAGRWASPCRACGPRGIPGSRSRGRPRTRSTTSAWPRCASSSRRG